MFVQGRTQDQCDDDLDATIPRKFRRANVDQSTKSVSAAVLLKKSFAKFRTDRLGCTLEK